MFKFFICIVMSLLLSGCGIQPRTNNTNFLDKYIVSEYDDAYGNSNSNLQNGGFIAFDEDNIYYAEIIDDVQTLWGLQNGEHQKICELNYMYLNIVDDNFYYVDNVTNFIMKMDANNKEKRLIVDIKSRYLITYKEKLYFISREEENNNCLFSADLNGGNITQLTYEGIGDVWINNDTIFYSTSNPDTIHSIKNSEDKIEFSSSKIINSFCVADNCIVAEIDNSIYKIVDNKKEMLVENPMLAASTFSLISDTRFMFMSLKDYDVHFIDLESGGQETFKTNLDLPGLVGIIYTTNQGVFRYKDNNLYKLQKDGFKLLER